MQSSRGHRNEPSGTVKGAEFVESLSGS